MIPSLRMLAEMALIPVGDAFARSAVLADLDHATVAVEAICSVLRHGAGDVLMIVNPSLTPADLPDR